MTDHFALYIILDVESITRLALVSRTFYWLTRHHVTSDSFWYNKLLKRDNITPALERKGTYRLLYLETASIEKIVKYGHLYYIKHLRLHPPLEMICSTYLTYPTPECLAVVEWACTTYTEEEITHTIEEVDGGGLNIGRIIANTDNMTIAVAADTTWDTENYVVNSITTFIPVNAITYYVKGSPVLADSFASRAIMNDNLPYLQAVPLLYNTITKLRDVMLTSSTKIIMWLASQMTDDDITVSLNSIKDDDTTSFLANTEVINYLAKRSKNICNALAVVCMHYTPRQFNTSILGGPSGDYELLTSLPLARPFNQMLALEAVRLGQLRTYKYFLEERMPNESELMSVRTTDVLNYILTKRNPNLHNRSLLAAVPDDVAVALLRDTRYIIRAKDIARLRRFINRKNTSAVKAFCQHPSASVINDANLLVSAVESRELEIVQYIFELVKRNLTKEVAESLVLTLARHRQPEIIHWLVRRREFGSLLTPKDRKLLHDEVSRFESA